MGKTKIKTIDDSALEEPKKREDSLVAKLNAELGIGETQAGEAPKSDTANTSDGGRAEGEDSSEVIATPATPDRNDKKHKPSKSRPRSKKYQAVSKNLDRTKFYPLPEALDMVKKLSYAKFNGQSSGSLEAHINTAQTGVRGMISLPFARGTKLRILAFGPNLGLNKLISEDVFFGDDETIEKIAQGKVDFDLIITTPDWMPKLAKVAKVLGPKGLMPNPKNGTITNDVEKAIESFQSGKTEFKTEDKAPVIHLSLGKLNQPSEELLANVKILLSSIGKSKIKKVSLAPTMGPSVKLDLSTI